MDNSSNYRNNSERDRYFHNEGEKAYKNNNYRKPWDDHLGGITNSQRQARDQDKFDEGWRNSRNQSDED